MFNFHVKSIRYGQFTGVITTLPGSKPVASTLPTSDRNEAARRALSLRSAING
jgi:hypothetical protein